MKNLTILKKKIISDNQLSFLFLINKINYKKLKSITKRSLLPHYIIYKFLLKALNINFNTTFHRNFIQLNNKLNFLLPGMFIEKRMFFKSVKFISAYSWYNTKITSFLKKSTYFDKFITYPMIGGQTIVSSVIKDENLGLFSKSFFIYKNVNFNYYIFFNLSLLNILELYALLNLIWFNRLWIK